MHDFIMFLSVIVPSFFIGFFGTFWAVWGITTFMPAYPRHVKND